MPLINVGGILFLSDVVRYTSMTNEYFLAEFCDNEQVIDYIPTYSEYMLEPTEQLAGELLNMQLMAIDAHGRAAC